MYACFFTGLHYEHWTNDQKQKNNVNASSQSLFWLYVPFKLFILNSTTNNNVHFFSFLIPIYDVPMLRYVCLCSQQMLPSQGPSSSLRRFSQSSLGSKAVSALWGCRIRCRPFFLFFLIFRSFLFLCKKW